ncbi:MAG TPA: L-seryl-tRNA(Sec) selenium transferase, partial [Thermodesulfobacteriota bacterium]|nr:L-seryl-tRNA(Sec) selenium transferase [Thermodesulfobacteriota bacterium]
MSRARHRVRDAAGAGRAAGAAEQLRRLPSVTELLKTPAVVQLLGRQPRALVVEALRTLLAEERQRIRQGAEAAAFNPDAFVQGLPARLDAALAARTRPSLRRLINATGVVLHTNLGRSVLAPEAIAAMETVAAGYSTLEFDLASGERGSRHAHVERLLTALTGAEAACVVNNNAGATLIALNTLAAGREAIVSRGELVEIGGAYRMPEVMAASGVTLREVGTTNKTYLRDYEAAIGERTALLVRVHTSNYRILGFTHQVEGAELAALAHRRGLAALEDLGSGCLVDLARFGLEREPTVQEAVASGMDVVTFSGDKLLGGPQAGLLVGRAAAIAAVKKNPLMRALRPDKLTLAALEATLRLYEAGPEVAAARIPTLRMLALGPAELARRARRLRALLRRLAPDLPA